MMSAQCLTRWVWRGLLAIFLSITAYYIAFHHVAPLSRDQWHMYDALFQQSLWQTSITTVSGHRHILAFLLYDIDLHVFGGNNNFLIIFDWLLNLGLIAVLCWKIKQCVVDVQSRNFLMGWTVLLLCWLINIALLGWGFNGVNNYLSILNTVLSIVFLYQSLVQEEKRSLSLFISVFLGGLATFSFGNGILVWPIGLLMLYACRAPRFYFGVFTAAAALFFVLYLALPGGDAVGSALHLNGWKTLRFPIELMGGPAYHLLRAWHLLSEETLVSLAASVGMLVCLLTLFVLWQFWRRREKNDALDVVAITLILIGFGTVALLLLTRVDGVLDPTVDRFQIWALLVWLGSSVLLYRRIETMRIETTSRKYWQIFFLVFPVLALPSQLDWGARLAEYRVRVDNALLAYQVYLPVAADAEKALHWNWQGKLPHLFSVLENLRVTQRNVFADGAAAWLGKPLPVGSDVPVCRWFVVRTTVLHAADLLDVTPYPNAGHYAVATVSPASVVGESWYGQLDEAAWNYGLIADSAGIVRGLLQPVRASLLPRANGLRYSGGNAYGIARTDQAAKLLVMDHGKPRCVAVLH